MSKIKTLLHVRLPLLPGLLMLSALAAFTVVPSKTADLNTTSRNAGNESQKPLRSFNPARQKSISKASQNLIVSLDRWEPCENCPAGIFFTFLIKDLVNGTVKTATIRDETAQIDEILLTYPTRIVVIGSANGTTRTVNILNSDSGELVDHFLCSYPSLSSNGRFLAFVRFAPRFSAPEDWSYTYLIYDLRKEASQNRSQTTDRAEEIGIQVYPAETIKQNKRTAIDESSAHILASEDLFWIEDDKLAFVDRANKLNTLVVVDLHAGTERAKVKTRALETAKLVKKCGESDSAPENLINVTGIALTSGPKKVAHLNLEPMGPCSRTTEIDLAIE